MPTFSASPVLAADGQEPDFPVYFIKHTPGALQINSKQKGKKQSAYTSSLEGYLLET